MTYLLSYQDPVKPRPRVSLYPRHVFRNNKGDRRDVLGGSPTSVWKVLYSGHLRCCSGTNTDHKTDGRGVSTRTFSETSSMWFLCVSVG